eukprot:scaffold68741_cov20-Tisochrysis_lutea.AAC.1
MHHCGLQPVSIGAFLMNHTLKASLTSGQVVFVLGQPSCGPKPREPSCGVAEPFCAWSPVMRGICTAGVHSCGAVFTETL